MKYKVCIQTAGRGTRNTYANNMNKAILPLGGRAVISHIIEKVHGDTEIVVIVGHKKELIKEYLDIVYPHRNITFIEVDKYEGDGSGVGHSLLCAKDHLQCPFVLFACDTYISGDIPLPDKNWIGISNVNNSKDYLISIIENNKVVKFFDKEKRSFLLNIGIKYSDIINNAFIGLAGINNYKTFFDGLLNDEKIIKGELQVSSGLNNLIETGLETIRFTWYDTGNNEGYEKANNYFNNNKVLVKPNENIYFEGNKVIKFFSNKETVKKRVMRSRILSGIVPKIINHTDNFYAYEFIKGKNIGEINKTGVFQYFLEFCKKKLWIPKRIDEKIFKEMCHNFYFNKTQKRVDLFLSNNKDEEEIINGIHTESINSLLKQIDWNELYNGVPVLFHGDPQPENVIYSSDGNFTLIDWREDFGGNLEVGDIYYDFAKIYHALTISGTIIRDNHYSIKKNKNEIEYCYYLKSNLVEFKEVFEKWIIENKYDLNKVKLLSALIYLNIAPLHHTPYNQLLYYLGKYKLNEVLKK